MTKLINYYNTLSKEEKIYLCEHYFNWVESESNVYPHHVRRAGYCGMGQKPPHIFCIKTGSNEEHAEYHASHLKESKLREIKEREMKKLQEANDEYFELYIEHKLEGI